MSLQRLLSEGHLTPHVCTVQEITDLLEMAESYLGAVSVAANPLAVRFVSAYSAAFALATAVLAASGYRASGPRHHRTTFDALPFVLGPRSGPRSRYFDRCRRKRNIAIYTRVGEVAEADVANLAREADAFRAEVLAWLHANHPELLPQE